ncbi:MAG: hypothetical protein A3D33_14450 [Candidatus Rokubacteria bacterium RIFCSPHIGHO2_02_FULL_73_26]|nr:MAG: hypothetical protein A3D33_14450 [Candidatus Rokubacteria bacterium RIFCSPHIGHO2_02_FULL_73_26]
MAAARRVALVLVALGAAALLPHVAGPFWTGLVTQMYVFGLLALSVDLLLGHTGLFSLCHASFFAVAAYTTAILQVRHDVPTALAAPAGILAGTLLALVFGLAVRTRGVYFILITLAFGYVVWGMAHRWSSFTGGDNGVTNVPFPAVGGLRVESHTEYYYLVLAVVLLCAIGYRVLVASPCGASRRARRGCGAWATPPACTCTRPSSSPGRSRAWPACSTSTTTASSTRSPRPFRSRSRPP